MKARILGFAATVAMIAAVIAAWANSSTSAQAFSANDDLLKSCMVVAKNDCTKWAAEGGGGGGFPRGLSNGTTVELAPGERYVLSGTVLVVKDTDTQQLEVYLKVDLDEHPWLASAKRKSQPYYRVNDDANRWKKYNKKYVTGVFKADASIWQLGTDRYTYEIFLTPIEGTVIAE